MATVNPPGGAMQPQVPIQVAASETNGGPSSAGSARSRSSMPDTGDGRGQQRGAKQALMPTPQAAGAAASPGTAASRRTPRAKVEEPNLKGAPTQRARVFSRSMPGAGMQENTILRRVEVPAVGRRPHVFAPPGTQVAEPKAAPQVAVPAGQGAAQAAASAVATAEAPTAARAPPACSSALRLSLRPFPFAIRLTLRSATRPAHSRSRR